MFMDDTTLSEVIEVSDHTFGDIDWKNSRKCQQCSSVCKAQKNGTKCEEMQRNGSRFQEE
jgi:hypothetical protein